MVFVFQSKTDTCESNLLYYRYYFQSPLWIYARSAGSLRDFAVSFFIYGDSLSACALGNLMLGECIALASGTDSALLFGSRKVAEHEDEIEDP